MEHNEHMENLLEAVMMAQEVGDTTVAGILGARAEDVQISLTEQDIEAAQGEGLVVREGQEVRLTEAGAEIARRVVRRHRLSEMLLFTLLGVDRELASEIACRVEHGLREEMLEGVCTLLGHPAACPHGRPIPPGECCAAGARVVERQVVPITELKPGEKGRIVYIQPKSHQRLHRLTSIGLMPGVVVELHRRSPAFCLRFEETDVALDPDVARDIHVSRLPR